MDKTYVLLVDHLMVAVLLALLVEQLQAVL